MTDKLHAIVVEFATQHSLPIQSITIENQRIIVETMVMTETDEVFRNTYTFVKKAIYDK
jgi:hypothetical protein